MADTKISAMTTASTLTGGEIMPLVQSSNNVQQTVSNIVNQTLAVAPSTSRTALGLGTMATQNANNVAITGGTEDNVSYTDIKTPGLTGWLYGNDTGVVTASATIPAGAIATQYGAFQNNATQTNVTPGVGIPTQFDTNDINGHGVEVLADGSGNKTKVTVDTAGIYNFQFSYQLNKNAGGSAAIDVYIWAAKNGVAVPETNTRVTIQGPSSYTVAAWNLWIQMAANDYVQLMWASADSHAEITYISPAAIGPIVPSVILTVNRIA